MEYTKLIQVFEYDMLIVNKSYVNSEEEEVLFTREYLSALRDFGSNYDTSFFKVTNNQIKFSSYVGVIQVQDLIIEVLPKIDKTSDNKKLWRDVLLRILKQTEEFDVKQTDKAMVRPQKVHLLDIFFEAYLKEIKILIRKGLIKQYIKEESNKNVLKGQLKFEKHSTKNLIHKTKFYTQQKKYTLEHSLHAILVRAVEIIANKNKGTELYKNCQKLLIHFPDFSNRTITKKELDKIKITRKNAHYEKAFKLAKVIILNLGPDIAGGKQEMVALLFNMFSLWEKYVYQVLRKEMSSFPDLKVTRERQKIWGTNELISDIIIRKGEETYILDTKWKLLKNTKTPGAEDIRQIYTYCKFWNSKKGALLYPSHITETIVYKDYKNKYDLPKIQAAVGEISVFRDKERLIFDKQLGRNILLQLGVIT